jgi:Fe-S-cluster-containing dehydrogenase component
VKSPSKIKKTILINHNECTGCMMCAMACSLEKTNIFNPASSRIRIANWEEKGVIVPIMCQHCAEPVCMPCCPVDAISKNPKTELVEIDSETCTNCKICRKVCPYGGPSFDCIRKQVVMCDHCGGHPACVDVCPTEALHYCEVDRHNEVIRFRGMGQIRKSIVDLGGN